MKPAVLAACTLMLNQLPAVAQTDAPGPAALVDALNGTFGKHAGKRASHAKGFCARGDFIPAAKAAQFAHSPFFAQSKVDALLRFSIGGGNPGVSDKSRSVRGLSMRLTGGGETYDLLLISEPVAFTFYAQLPAPGDALNDSSQQWQGTDRVTLGTLRVTSLAGADACDGIVFMPVTLPADAEDAVQEALLGAIKAWDSYQGTRQSAQLADRHPAPQDRRRDPRAPLCPALTGWHRCRPARVRRAVHERRRLASGSVYRYRLRRHQDGGKAAARHYRNLHEPFAAGDCAAIPDARIPRHGAQGNWRQLHRECGQSARGAVPRAHALA
nr:catalase [Duganella sacchari]